VLISDFKVGVRQFIANPGYTFVLVVGLAVAIATASLLWAFIIVSLQTDDDIPNADRVFRLESRVELPGVPQGWIEHSPMPLKEVWKNAGAPVEASTRLYEVDMSIKVGTKIVLMAVTFVDPEFPDLFPIHALHGDLRTSLNRPDSIAVSERVSEQLFGTQNALGRNVLIGGVIYSIGAILPTRAKESVVNAGLLMSLKSQALPDKSQLEKWYGLKSQNFVKLLPNGRIEDLLACAKEQLEQSPWYRGLPLGFIPAGKTLWTPRAVALNDLRTLGANSGKTKRLMMGLAIATAMIALLATINFVNLTTVRIAVRQSEIGVRKAIGALPQQVAALFLTESVTIALAAFVLALPLAFVFALAFEASTQIDVVAAMRSPARISVLLIGSVLLGMFVGAYPAWIAYHMRVVTLISGRGTRETGSSANVRRALTTFQFGVAIVMFGCASVVYVQADFATRVDPGFDPQGLLFLDAPVNLKDPRLQAFRDAVAELPNVTAVALSRDVPGRGKNFSPIRVRDDQGRALSLTFVSASPDFFNTYGIKAMAGRVFERPRDAQGLRDVVVVSKLAVKQLGFPSELDAIGRNITLGGNPSASQIIGVVQDIRLRSLKEELRPTVYYIGNPDIQAVTVRTSNLRSSSEKIAELWLRYFSDDALKIERLTSQLARNYIEDRQLAELVGVAAIIALIISASGSYTLAAYTVERKTREIVLRRLYGATTINIVRLIGKDLLWSTATGAVIGVPIVLLIGAEYIREFGAESPIWPLSAVLSVLVIGGTVILAASIHIRAALRITPAHAFGA
jgi:putative ABC transport system permease protein